MLMELIKTPLIEVNDKFNRAAQIKQIEGLKKASLIRVWGRDGERRNIQPSAFSSEKSLRKKIFNALGHGEGIGTVATYPKAGLAGVMSTEEFNIPYIPDPNTSYLDLLFDETISRKPRFKFAILPYGENPETGRDTKVGALTRFGGNVDRELLKFRIHQALGAEEGAAQIIVFGRKGDSNVQEKIDHFVVYSDEKKLRALPANSNKAQDNPGTQPQSPEELPGTTVSL